MKKQLRKHFWIFLVVAGLACAGWMNSRAHRNPASQSSVGRMIRSIPNPLNPKVERDAIASALGERRFTGQDLRLDFLPIDIKGKNYHAHLTLNRDLQERVEELYERYQPEFAAFVAIDPQTGRVLALADYSRHPVNENLALQATYPAASVFKVVTSAAAVDQGKVGLNTLIPVTGSYTTLYKQNLRDASNRWTRYLSIQDAFAKSVNTAFGKIAINRLGHDTLQKYADAFGFNRSIPFDMSVGTAKAQVPSGDWFGLAESGSGYTRRQTLSPLLGALIPASIINGGRMPTPYLVESLSTPQGAIVYEAEEDTLSQTLDRDAAKTMAMIMENTVTRGTARKEFRDYNSHPILRKLFIGAKTGTLTGHEPFGKYDWFVGFAQSSEDPTKKIAFASMIVNRAYWRVKSAHIAREAVIAHFRNGGADL